MVVEEVSKFTPVNTVLSTDTLLHDVPPFVERQTSISTGPAVFTLPPEYLESDNTAVPLGNTTNPLGYR